jgi:hypothetical protein
MDTHNTGINEAFLVKRNLKLTGLTEQKIEEFIPEIQVIRGIDTVEFDATRERIRVSYDASVTSIDSILKILKQHSVEPKNGWWNQFKLDWNRQIDQNVSDNAKHVPHCCSKPPPGH